MMAKAALIVFSLFITHSGAVQFDYDKSNKNDDCTERPVNEFQSVKPSWLAAILRNDRGKKEYVCAGSLVRLHTVVTSATCAKHLRPYRTIVRAGEWDIPNAKETENYVDRDVRRIIMHEEYRSHDFYNDIALLIFEGEIEHPRLGISQLASPYQDFDDADCYAIGWGNRKYEEGATLKKLNLPVVEHNTCQNDLRKTYLGSRFLLHKSFLCAGGEHGVDTCTSDGGMPLLCKRNDDYKIEQQIGIVSWGIGCGRENIPGVYANVSHFFLWIRFTAE